ncbi:dimethylmenaquinone methyltransferase [Meridianimarinicoccus roseus]|uniref:Putative 4-hydroxy-4-methyl-2-oxoglutarate aldolase n=1 Tax=Meridianimarinicoccus roseus TaxID=2072018 RepID=A0A2V2LCZ5_9RHOB|nr:dimethylmenaquinone methyltransferase [Meridianimarinicoccus roseus]
MRRAVPAARHHRRAGGVTAVAEPDLPSRLAALGTATIGEVAPQARLFGPGLHPVQPGRAFAGPAATVRCAPGDNLALHRAIARLAPGEVLVVDYANSLESGPFGEIMALACQMRGCAGLVTNGAVRDLARLRDSGFGVVARGAAIRGTTKADPGELGVPITLAGTTVAPGDLVVADDDAVLALSPDGLGAVLSAAEARQAKEEEMMRRLRAGETTLRIMGLEERD